jgi:hypothetical protein
MLVFLILNKNRPLWAGDNRSHEKNCYNRGDNPGHFVDGIFGLWLLFEWQSA